MTTVTLEGAKNFKELAQRAYGLKAGDPRIDTAAKALAQANPKLSADLSTMPKATPVTVPPVAGLSDTASAPPPALATNLLKTIGLLPDTVKQMMAAAQPGSTTQDPARAAMLQRFTQVQTALKVTPTPVKKTQKKQSGTGLQSLNDDVTAFLKAHGS